VLLETIGTHLGVEYQYEESIEEEVSKTSSRVEIDLEELLVALPEDMFEQLKFATMSGNFSALMEITDQIEDENPKLASDLRNLVKQYDYDALSALFVNGESE